MGSDGQEHCCCLCDKPCSTRGALVSRLLEPQTSVRRNLFGPVDHDQLQRDFQRQLRGSLEAARRKWSFDFARDLPLEGALEWESLGCQEVPSFYRSQAPGSAQVAPATARETRRSVRKRRTASEDCSIKKRFLTVECVKQDL
ncbi:cyclin-dependent kinase inhibitor 1 [Microcaecilia unicolor]|uniref:Cyclin-dependent kinase inhibitor 1-like n=1 Tax=Microcaecilia unicolor TaxID=1415580 RepID=A0A6P7YW09_9AMPH|nr:cyclin-dependent kinase inhibitor 1-like [Microcaecilia unicolor]